MWYGFLLCSGLLGGLIGYARTWYIFGIGRFRIALTVLAYLMFFLVGVTALLLAHH